MKTIIASILACVALLALGVSAFENRERRTLDGVWLTEPDTWYPEEIDIHTHGDQVTVRLPNKPKSLGEDEFTLEADSREHPWDASHSGFFFSEDLASYTASVQPVGLIMTERLQVHRLVAREQSGLSYFGTSEWLLADKGRRLDVHWGDHVVCYKRESLLRRLFIGGR